MCTMRISKGDLSPNFDSDEFVCKCCGEGTVTHKLVWALQQLRDMAGAPITVLSGYRCPKHNKEVGGSENSQHLLGKAADIMIQGLSVPEMAALAEQVQAFGDGGIGTYPDQGFIHVDVREGKARWVK